MGQREEVVTGAWTTLPEVSGRRKTSRLVLDVIAWDTQAYVFPDRRSLSTGGPGTLRTCCVFRNSWRVPEEALFPAVDIEAYEGL